MVLTGLVWRTFLFTIITSVKFHFHACSFIHLIITCTPAMVVEEGIVLHLCLSVQNWKKLYGSEVT